MSQRRYTPIHVIVAIVTMFMLVMSSRPESAPGMMVAHAIPCGINCLDVTNAPTASVRLNGSDQTVSYALTFSLENQSALGWNVTITSTQFISASHGHTLAPTASAITAMTAVCQPLQTCTTMPTNAVTYPVAVPADNPAPTAVKFYNAAAGSGEGTFDISTTITISIPANAYAGSYSSTITLAYVSGP
ncbi:MAG: WxL domain-containing protein [Chloroflexota bacterium]|nr:WxL domain-containing protein [Chloroflexota bacterium]